MQNKYHPLHWLGLTLLLIPTLVSASTYNIEVILFERYSGGDQAWSTDFGSPDFGSARANLSASSGGGARLLGGKSLGGIAQALRKKGIKVHAHVRWQQNVPNQQSKSWYQIGNGNVGGLISVSRGHYLHLDTDLLIRHQGNAYRAKLGRRMRSGELHYLDHPKIGIIALAQRAGGAGAAKPAQTANTTQAKPTPTAEQDEPKPATENNIPRATADPS